MYCVLYILLSVILDSHGLEECVCEVAKVFFWEGGGGGEGSTQISFFPTVQFLPEKKNPRTVSKSQRRREGSD